MSRRVRINGTPSPPGERPLMRTRVAGDDRVNDDSEPAEDDEELGRAETVGRSPRSLGEGPAEGFLRQQGGGRPIGAQSHMTRRLKEAIYAAGEEIGFDGRGTDGMKGYLKRPALHDVAAYTSLLRMVLPRQVYAQVEASSVVLEVLKITQGGEVNGYPTRLLEGADA